jgi:type III restriction enzyme
LPLSYRMSSPANKLGIGPAQATSATEVANNNEPPAFRTPEEQKIAQITYEIIQRMENDPQRLPCVSYLNEPGLQAEVTREEIAGIHR